MQAFTGAVKFILNDLRRVSVQIDARIAKDVQTVADAMEEWKPHAQTFLHSISLATPIVKMRLNTSYVMTMGLVILGAADNATTYKKALTFLEMIAMNDGLRRGDPAKAAVDYIVGSDPRSMGDTIDKLRTLASAWNRFYRNGQIEFLRRAPQGPVSFEGTRFNARRLKNQAQSQPETRRRAHHGGEAPAEGIELQ